MKPLNIILTVIIWLIIVVILVAFGTQLTGCRQGNGITSPEKQDTVRVGELGLPTPPMKEGE